MFTYHNNHNRNKIVYPSTRERYTNSCNTSLPSQAPVAAMETTMLAAPSVWVQLYYKGKKEPVTKGRHFVFTTHETFVEKKLLRHIDSTSNRNVVTCALPWIPSLHEAQEAFNWMPVRRILWSSARIDPYAKHR